MQHAMCSQQAGYPSASLPAPPNYAPRNGVGPPSTTVALGRPLRAYLDRGREGLI